MANEFGRAEREGICPVPLDQLGELYRRDPDGIIGMVGGMSEDARIKLAVFCYGRAHLREIGLTIAAQCSETRLTEMAGMIGQVLAVQCRAKSRSFGSERDRGTTQSKPKVSLAGSRG